MSRSDLADIASKLCAPGKGLLASDESTGTIGKRLEKHGIENTESARREYRELFYTAPVGQSISGVIMFSETLQQSTSDGTPFVKCLADKGILAGIKVDQGLELTSAPGTVQGETTTKGIDTLDERCKVYVDQGASFAKWRAALCVGNGAPTEAAIELNALQLAQYAAICQSNGLVPIVEPELLIDGDHDVDTFGQASARSISACINQLWRHNVQLEGVLFKPQMIVPGADYTGAKPSADVVATHTLRTLRQCVPPAIPGIMFLSGGLSEVEATANLNAINCAAQQQGKAPWALSFSFGRALQASVLKLWSEDRSNVERCRIMAAGLANANGKACLGQWDGQHPSITSDGGALNLREGFRGWNGSA